MNGILPTSDTKDAAVTSRFVGLLAGSLGVTTFGVLDGNPILAAVGLCLVWVSILGFSLFSSRARQTDQRAVKTLRHRERLDAMAAYVHHANDDRERAIELLSRMEG